MLLCAPCFLIWAGLWHVTGVLSAAGRRHIGSRTKTCAPVDAMSLASFHSTDGISKGLLVGWVHMPMWPVSHDPGWVAGIRSSVTCLSTISAKQGGSKVQDVKADGRSATNPQKGGGQREVSSGLLD